MKSKNPGIASLSEDISIGDYSDLDGINKFAEKNKVEFAFIGPEDPLNNGVVDKLQEIGIPSVGPTKLMSRLETSKSFTRELLEKYDIDGNPKFKVINHDNLNELNDFLNETEEVVVKPDGLTGGKGVKVQGDHFDTKEEALKYCIEVLETHSSVIVEEKLDGEEFSLQCLTDGKTVVATPPVQDHKRAYEDDKGPNTGGMGSYSSENHLLPFLKKKDVDEALEITKKVADAINKETGLYYKGVMYGGFILTKQGIKLIEYNARFGDPEVMNILPLLKTDFASICQAIIVQELGRVKIKFEKKATVCKYVVPEGYPDKPVKNEKVSVSKQGKAKMYYSSVDEKKDGLYMTGSRAIAFLGIGSNLEEAEKIAEDAVSNVKGKVFHRKDIGTKELVGKRVSHVGELI
jgi:phosphoribosylamine--glycine ligase